MTTKMRRVPATVAMLPTVKTPAPSGAATDAVGGPATMAVAPPLGHDESMSSSVAPWCVMLGSLQWCGEVYVCGRPITGEVAQIYTFSGTHAKCPGIAVTTGTAEC
jgi:hypothetical protein